MYFSCLGSYVSFERFADVLGTFEGLPPTRLVHNFQYWGGLYGSYRVEKCFVW